MNESCPTCGWNEADPRQIYDCTDHVHEYLRAEMNYKAVYECDDYAEFLKDMANRNYNYYSGGL
jgi:hypothetical protein